MICIRPFAGTTGCQPQRVAFPVPVQPHAQARPGKPRHHAGNEKPLGVQRRAKSLRAQRASQCQHITDAASFQPVNGVQIGIALKNIGKAAFDGPAQECLRQRGAQRIGKRQRMGDIAQRTQLDEENALQGGRISDDKDGTTGPGDSRPAASSRGWVAGGIALIISYRLRHQAKLEAGVKGRIAAPARGAH